MQIACPCYNAMHPPMLKKAAQTPRLEVVPMHLQILRRRLKRGGCRITDIPYGKHTPHFSPDTYFLMRVRMPRHRRNAAADAERNGKRKGIERSEPCLVELLRNNHDTVGRLKVIALSNELQSAIDLFKIDLDLAPRCLYLLHPCQAIGSLLHWEHFLGVLLHGPVTFP
jgi:hypothetical protein